MSGPTLLELVANGTLDERVAASLRAIVESRHSFLVTAAPRFAGKTALSDAMLNLVSPGTPVHRLSGDESEMKRLAQAPDGGYLVVGEISRASPSHYIWGRAVRTVFETARAGFSLAAALHAPDLQGAFAVICSRNAVPDEDASRIRYVIHIARRGRDAHTFWRRVATVHEVETVERGVPVARLLHRWDEVADRFETVAQARHLSHTPSCLDDRAGGIKKLVQTGRTSEDDAAALAGGGPAPRTAIEQPDGAMHSEGFAEG